MATEPKSFFVKDIQEGDQIMIGGQLHEVVDWSDAPGRYWTRQFLLRHLTTHSAANLTLEAKAIITIRRPIK